MARKSVAERLWAKVEHSSGCWEWKGSKNNHGYGRISVAGHPAYAHRIAYELVTGEDITGKHLLHTCDNPGCVNPSHLTPGTAADNMRDMAQKGRDNPWNRGKTHCKRGHALPGEPNTFDGRGKPYRRCLVCRSMLATKEYRTPESHERKLRLQRERRARQREERK